MKKNILSALKFILLLSAGLFLLYFAFRGQDPAKLLADMKQADYSWVLLSLLVSLVAHFLRAVRWKMLIRPLGYEPSSVNTFYAVMSGYIANLAVPRMGEVTRCGALNRSDEIPLNQLIGTVVAERVIDLLTLIVILFFSIYSQFSVVGNFLNDQLLQPLQEKLAGKGLLLGLILVFGIILLILFIRFSKKRKASTPQKTWIDKIINLLNGIKNGLVSVTEIKGKWLFFLYTVLIWLGYFLSTYFCFFALHATSSLTLSDGLFILAIGGLGMSAPVQGGIGAYHWIVSQGLILFGIAQADGLAYATISHSAQQILILLVGGFSVIVLILKRKNK